MKILQIASGDLWAGAEVQLYHLAKHLNRQNHVEVVVVLLNEGRLAELLRAEKIDVHVFSEAECSLTRIIKKVNQLVKKITPDLIHSHRQKENLIASIVGLVHRIKSVRTVHGADEHSTNLKEKIISFVDNFNAKFLQHKLIAVSEELHQRLSLQFGTAKVVHIDNSIDINEVKLKADEKISLNLASEIHHLGFVGRLSDVKQVNKIIDIIGQIKQQVSNKSFHLHIIGDGPLAGDLKKQTERLNLVNDVTFYGFLSNPQPYIKAFDAILFTSKHEGLPITLLEALVLETPVFSTPLPTFVRLLNQQEDYAELGNFIDTDSKKAASQIINAFSHHDDLIKRANDASKLVRQKYDIDKNIVEYVSLYQSMLGQ